MSTSGAINDVTTLIIIYGLLLAGTTTLNYLMEYPHTRLSNSIYEKLRIMALAQVSRKDYAAYQNIGTGQLINSSKMVPQPERT